MNLTEDNEKVRDKCPCDRCDHFNLCKKEELACRSFAKFVVDNYYYRDSFRDPSKEIFKKVFDASDDALSQFVREWKSEDPDKSNT